MKRHRIVGIAMAFTIGLGPEAARLVGQDQHDTPAPAVLWIDPGDIRSRDLFWGPGNVASAPQPPFAFLKEDTSGTKPKVVVRDVVGTIWNVKFAGPSRSNNEVHAEIAASRLAWAFGYAVEEHYYVAEGIIQGAAELGRASTAVLPDGRFRVARFERRDPSITRTGRHWSLANNPFKDTKELSGLMLVLALVNNWDTKTSNFSVFRHESGEGRPQDLYVVSDFGSSFGKMGPPTLFPSRNRWSLEDYRAEPYVEAVDEEFVHINHKGDLTIDEVPLDHARWFGGLAAELSAQQVRRAFEAAGASPDEISGFADRVMEKLSELRNALTAANT